MTKYVVYDSKPFDALFTYIIYINKNNEDATKKVVLVSLQKKDDVVQ